MIIFEYIKGTVKWVLLLLKGLQIDRNFPESNLVMFIRIPKMLICSKEKRNILELFQDGVLYNSAELELI